MGGIYKGRGNERGQAMVEMALVLPLLLLLLWGVVEFGRLGHAYLTTAHAAREGARLGTVGHSDQAIMEEIQRRTGSLSQDQLTVIITPGEQQRFAGVSLQVEIEYYMDFYLPVLNRMLPNPYPIKSTMIMRVE